VRINITGYYVTSCDQQTNSATGKKTISNYTLGMNGKKHCYNMELLK